MTEVNPSAIPVKPAGVRPRLDSLDLLRGWIMIFMALDHVRDFFHADVFAFGPQNLDRTNAALFFTRWITHFCAPVFCFLAGTGAFLSLSRGKTRGQLSYFLLTRGLWLLVLELTWIQLSWTFNFASILEPGGAVLWMLGWSMIALAALLHLPLWAVAAFGVVMIAGHNLLDPIVPQQLGRLSGLWTVLHEGGLVRILPNVVFYVAYPLVPWIGVMAAGFAFGTIVKRERAERRPLLLWLGVALTLAFVAIRLTNVYGDPQPWTPHARGALFTFLSFLNVEKYPPSFLFLLMTLGPSLVALWLFDRKQGRLAQPVITIGRVPLFFYLLHLPLIHILALLYSYATFGHASGLFVVPPFWAEGETRALYPENYGYGLAGVYVVWVITVLLLYPLCVWFAKLKQRRRDAWLSYF
ncbi:MAG: DUF1624 domain-containing protein [Chthoniobacterales bacterium]|nr:DUF1624 domain-containing protein [Chthoniobacterales bacterium]